MIPLILLKYLQNYAYFSNYKAKFSLISGYFNNGIMFNLQLNNLYANKVNNNVIKLIIM